MGLYDKLNRNIAAGMNFEDPLFGGLIPRRVEEDRFRPVSEPSNPVMPRPIRENGLERVSNNMLNNQNQSSLASTNPFENKNVVFDYTNQELGLKGKALDLEGRKLSHAESIAEKKYGLDVREQDRKEREDKNKLDLDRDKLEIDHRKQALDEWKTKNPEGEVKTTDDGKIVIIDKRTGKSIDTGISSGDLSEEKKLELAAKNAKELEELRQRNRIALERTEQEGRERLKTPTHISPSQQRVAERDAANEILNDPNYSWLEKKGYIIKESDGSITVNRPDKSKTSENFTIDAFEREVKKRSGERIGKTVETSRPPLYSKTDAPVQKTVQMVDPRDGITFDVPEEEVEAARVAGARLVGEEEPKSNRLINSIPPEAVDDNIELYYNDQGKVIGARNRKNPRISSFEQ